MSGRPAPGLARRFAGVSRTRLLLVSAATVAAMPGPTHARTPTPGTDPRISAAHRTVSRTHVEIPAFARKYRTTCSTCHTAAPKLNVLGEAFRLNGYRFPENDELLRRDRPVPLGAEPWKDLWPRSIWPGELPGSIPLALRIVNDLQVTNDPDSEAPWNFGFPDEIYILAGATLGETIGAFMSTEWSREEGLEAVQAKVQFQDPIAALPDRALNLWIGLQNLYLFTLADRQIDRATRVNYRWQTFRPSDIDLENPDTGETLASENGFRLRDTQPAIELNGIGGGRFYYGVGVSQGAGSLTEDNNGRKDLFYKVRYKLGGLRLDGTYSDGEGPVLGGRGQLMDRSVIFEHFGYFGEEPVAGDTGDSHRSFGVDARLLYGPLDLAVGYVWGRNRNPWGDLAEGELPHRSFFGRAEYLFYPWLIGSLKFDLFKADVPAPVRDAGFTLGAFDQTRILPGAIILIRHNVRTVLEAELFTKHAANDGRGRKRPHTLWVRLDVAF